MNEMIIGAIAFQNIGELDSAILEKTLHSKTTLKVPEHTRAMNVAADAQRMNAGLIVTIDAAGAMTGIVSPTWVCHQYNHIKGLTVNSFAQAIDIAEQDPREWAAGYRHEWLNFDRPDLYLCPEGHYVASKPCPEHNR